MCECAELLVLAVLGQAVLAALISIAVVDQGLMSPRLMSYTGVILGTLAAAWSVYSVQFRQEGLEAGELPEQEETLSDNRRRLRLFRRPEIAA